MSDHLSPLQIYVRKHWHTCEHVVNFAEKIKHIRNSEVYNNYLARTSTDAMKISEMKDSSFANDTFLNSNMSWTEMP